LLGRSTWTPTDQREPKKQGEEEIVKRRGVKRSVSESKIKKNKIKDEA